MPKIKFKVTKEFKNTKDKIFRKLEKIIFKLQMFCNTKEKYIIY